MLRTGTSAHVQTAQTMCSGEPCGNIRNR